MDQITSKDKLQKEGISRFKELSPSKGIAVVGTGLGKTKLAIDIIKLLKPKSVLILVNSTKLRDIEWKQEFEKWGLDWSIVTAECYQTAYKWEDKEFELVIADEIDFSLTEEYSKFYFNNKISKLLGLTAFIDPEKQELADQIAPTFIEFSTQQGQKEKILNKTKFIQVNYKLSDNKDLKIEYKDKQGKKQNFFQSENGMYEYYDAQFNKAVIALNNYRRKVEELKLFRKSDAEIRKTQKQLITSEWRMKMFARKRKELLQSLSSSRKLSKMLIKNILDKDKKNKVLLFSKTTEQVDQICDDTFHSKNKNNNIEKLNEGKIRTVGVCEALNRGINLVGVNHIIKESYVGSETDFQQQHGRGVRLNKDETLYFYILVPYYESTTKITQRGRTTYKKELLPTQAKKWLENMSKSFDLSNTETVDMTNVKL